MLSERDIHDFARIEARRVTGNWRKVFRDKMTTKEYRQIEEKSFKYFLDKYKKENK